ncbi:hypothetical protein RJ639_002201 [Escallonia herrerae]|uniref:peptidylprolyl isomerase n=1 Tax=Escallonia herrerae TaxID=1293975 RepID=A0AA88X951_9ASTE|nr:hypothetical protein RJ639_002201 [Escallonia herrerae]
MRRKKKFQVPNSEIMAFWGVDLEPSKPYTLERDDDGRPRRLRISQAVLANKDGHIFPRSAVQCCVGGKPPIRFCSLSHKERTSCQLDLEFEETEDVVFMAKGTAGVYLSGYFLKPTSCNTTTISTTINNAQSIVVHEKEDNVKIDNDDSGGFKPQDMSIVAVDYGDPQACPTAPELVRDADALDKQSGGINKELADVDNMDTCRSNKHMDGGNDALLHQHANDEKKIEAALAMVESDDRCVKESVHPKCNSEVPKADKGLGTDEELAVVKKMDRHICDNHVNGGNETFLQEHVTDENIGGAGLLTGSVSDDKCMKESVQKRCTSEVPKADIGAVDTPTSELKKHSDGSDEELAGAGNVDANVRHNHTGRNNEAILTDHITDEDNIGTGFMIDMSCRFIDESFQIGNPSPPNHLLNIDQDLAIHHLDGDGYASWDSEDWFDRPVPSSSVGWRHCGGREKMIREISIEEGKVVADDTGNNFYIVTTDCCSRRLNSLSVSLRENFEKVNVGEDNLDKLDLVQPNDALGSHSKLDDEGSHASAGICSRGSHSMPNKEKKRNYDLDDGISKQASSQEHEFIFKEREKETAKERAKEKDNAHDKKYGDGNKEKMQVGDPKGGDLGRNTSTNLNEVGTEDGAAEHREKTFMETDTFGDRSNSLLGDCIGRKRKLNEQPADCTDGDSCSEMVAMDSVEAGLTDSEEDDNNFLVRGHNGRKQMQSKKRADHAGNVQSSLEKLTTERIEKSKDLDLHSKRLERCHTFDDDKQSANKRINEESKVNREEAVVGRAKKKHKKVDVENVEGDADDRSGGAEVCDVTVNELIEDIKSRAGVSNAGKHRHREFVADNIESISFYNQSHDDDVFMSSTVLEKPHGKDLKKKKKKVITKVEESQKVAYSTKEKQHQAMCDRAVTLKKELEASGTLGKRKVHARSPQEIVCCLPAASSPMPKLLSGHTFDNDKQPAKKRINEESKVIREEAVVGSAKKKQKKVYVENVEGDSDDRSEKGGAEVCEMTVIELIEDAKSRVGGSNSGKHRHREFVADKIDYFFTAFASKLKVDRVHAKVKLHSFKRQSSRLISSYKQSHDVLLSPAVLEKPHGKDLKKKKKKVKKKVEESQKVACSTKAKQHQTTCDRNTGENDVRHELGESQGFDHQQVTDILVLNRAVTLKKELQSSGTLGKPKVPTGSFREIVCCLPAASSAMSKLLTGHTFEDDKQPAKKRINEESKVVNEEAVVRSAKKIHKNVDVENVKGDADDRSEKGGAEVCDMTVKELVDDIKSRVGGSNSGKHRHREFVADNVESISSYKQSHDVLLSSAVLEKPHGKDLKKKKKKVKTKVKKSQKVACSTKDMQHQAMCDRQGTDILVLNRALTLKKELQASDILGKHKAHMGSPQEIVCCLPAASSPMSKLLTGK